MASSKKSGKTKQSGKGTWRLLDTGAKVAAAVVATRASSLTWRAATGHRPPTQHPDLRLVEAVTWAALAGATVELSKVLINRKAVEYWVKSTGELPPGMKPLASMTADDLAAARAKDLAAVKKRIRKR
ncbi:DUF4235 domain-containing protein [Solicola sp. PLA-1-18]|uniref:DUF4235 domain-containing protein n=1 Tax=Solicola sp. PLA-1-18 TaxID=3380532 RepID=UPI003B7E5327